MNATPLPLSADELFDIALRAARGDEALAEEAALHVEVQNVRGLYEPRRGAVRTWARTVARRYCLDAWNRPFRAVGGDHLPPERGAPSRDLRTADARLDLTSPFGPADRAAVLGLAPRNRFVLLAWHGLWGKLTGDDQRDTLAAVGPAEPFPVPDFFDWPDKDRTRYLAAALRCRPNTVAQIRYRYQAYLASLRFVRELAAA
jgi:hypothetical protein